MRRLLLLFATALMLGGCNMVYAEHPLFTVADAAGAPQLRPGVWATRKADCAFDSAKPAKDWPECASATIVSADSVGGLDDKRMGYVMAGGDPRVMQLAFTPDDDKPTIYLFAGVRPLKSDAEGRITEARTWSVLCGPPPPPKAEAEAEAEAQGEEGADEAAAAPENETQEEMDARIQRDIDEQVNSSVTREPLPGLEVKDGMCIAREQGPVRNAAAASLAWDEGEPSVIYWVRDGAN
jgi:hypothetical protein